MAARRGDFQRAFDVFLALDLGEIQVVVVYLVENFGNVHLRRRNLDFAFEKTRRLAEILHRDNLQAGNDGGFGGIFRRNEHPGLAVRPRAEGDGQNAFGRAHRAGQREFTDDDEIVELIGFELFAGGQHAQRNRQIKSRSLLFHVGGREIDGRAAHREFEAGIAEGGGHTVARFLYRGVRQPDDDNQRVAPTGVDFDLDGIRFDAIERGGTNPR